MSLLSESYKVMLLKTKRGNCQGVFSNAKPIYVISLIDAIGEGIIIGNMIPYENEDLLHLYLRNYSNPLRDEDVLRRSNVKATAFNLPYFHLNVV